ncbi:hypothetical protein GLOIN_2v1761236 [Rhizophagus clarus]|uniref:Myb-like domain-containing protein n=1 Tax=Rhizophagus clarus TaxID=94130 RepID=A0A8H3QXK5_9GLOM|nr:hypothetical protein GLOIN_2v1761236 [Rhizophagus clarus]
MHRQHHHPILTESEIRSLISYVIEFGVDWEQIAILLRSKNVSECKKKYRRLIKKINRKRNHHKMDINYIIN